MSLPIAVLRPRKARPFFAHHPWVFDGAIARIEGAVQPGDTVELQSDRGEFVAYGLVNPKSKIRIRLYSWHREQPLTDELFLHRIKDAVRFRMETLRLGEPRAACRLVNSESDGLSGLIIDRFADVVTVQFNSLALARFENVVVQAITESVQPTTIYCRVDPSIIEREGIEARDGLLAGRVPEAPVVIEESGIRFAVDPVHGQKTGAYLDQRENRVAAARYARGKDVLDVFCYAGGFGLVAARVGEARSVLAVDSSADALALARENARRNEIPIDARQGDAGQVMTQLEREGRRFGLVVCDPPKFAAKAADVEGALRGYEFINRLAISLVEPGGVLVSCSCSGLVAPEMFLGVLTQASRKAGRELRLLEMRGHAPDHPVSLWCPESAYLKCAILRVM